MPQKKHVLVATLLLSLVAGLGVVTAPPANAASCAGLSDPNALQVHQGDMTVTQSGAVIENLEIRGTLRIQAPNVTVRNVWVYTSSFWTVYVDEKSNASLNIEYSEIGHPSHVGQRGIGGHNIRAKCIDIHHVEDGIKLGNNVVYDRIHVHHLASKSGSPHADAVQDDGGSRNAVVKNSTLNASSPLLSGNAAVIVKSDLGASRDITFVNNYLNGGAYVIFVRNGGHGMPQNVVFENNRIGDKFAYGVLSADGPVGWSGNVWASTGEPVDVGAQGAPAPRPPTTPSDDDHHRGAGDDHHDQRGARRADRGDHDHVPSFHHGRPGPGQRGRGHRRGGRLTGRGRRPDPGRGPRRDPAGRRGPRLDGLRRSPAPPGRLRPLTGIPRR